LHPISFWGTIEQLVDVGRAAAALARGEFPYSTGSVIMMGGGLVMPRLYLPDFENFISRRDAKAQRSFDRINKITWIL